MAGNGRARPNGNVPNTGGPDQRESRRKAWKRRLLVILQLLGCAGTIAFGVWAPISCKLSRISIEEQQIATNLTIAGLEEQRYSAELAEESNRWNKYAYDLGVAQLQVDLMGLCKDHPDIDRSACEQVGNWSNVNHFQSIVNTYNASTKPGVVPPPTIHKPIPFIPRGYPLPPKIASYDRDAIALYSVVGVVYAATIFGIMSLIFTGLI